MTLTEFLLARIAEDKAAAQQARDDGVGPGRMSGLWTTSVEGCGCCQRVMSDGALLCSVDDRYSPHIARWDPARVLAECESKRQIVELYRLLDPRKENTEAAIWVGVGECVASLALPYADHPDYQRDWAA